MVYRHSIEVLMKKLLTATALLLSLSACEFWEVDKCLDRGGRWNYEKEVCEFEKNVGSDQTNNSNQK